MPQESAWVAPYRLAGFQPALRGHGPRAARLQPAAPHGRSPQSALSFTALFQETAMTHRYTRLITAEQLAQLQAEGASLMVFDCSFNLFEPEEADPAKIGRASCRERV